MKDKYINDIEPMIQNWLKNGNENTTMIAYEIAEYVREQVKLCSIPLVSNPVKITKCKTFKNIDSYKHEKELNEWLSSNKIVIKHTNQSQFKQHNRSSYGDYYTYGTLNTIFYEDE